MTEPKKIVIVGAGPSGLATAFALTDPNQNPDWQQRYTVDVYQMGWRVGGKCATGRNHEAHERIQEHGIHVFGNMYFNAMQMAEQTFAEVQWDQHDKHRTMQEAFLPSVTTWNTEYWDHRWHPYLGYFPLSEGDPWRCERPSMEQVVQNVLFLVAQRIGELAAERGPVKGPWWRRLRRRAERRIANEIEEWGVKVGERLAREATDRRDPGAAADDGLIDLLDAVVTFLGWLVEREPDAVGLRQRFTEIDLAVTAIRGALEDGVFARDIDVLDGINYREWLIEKGLHPLTQVAAIPQGLPNTALSYEHGDTTAVPTMSAAAWLTFFLRQIIAVGAGAYFFKEGTGETIMKPLFRLLEQRGVRFHFFHKLVEVVPDGDGTNITELHFDVQATVLGDRYEPMRRLADGEWVWPDRPLYHQLREGDALRDGKVNLESWWADWKPVGHTVLRAGFEFDQVVLATPVATLPFTCARLIAHPRSAPTWGPMVSNVKTAATQAVQIWLSESPRDLGWDESSPAQGRRRGAHITYDRYVGGFFGQDLTSFCDFSDLISEERWPADRAPKGLIYFIGALPDPEEIPGFHRHDYPARMAERVKWATVQYLRNIDGVLPATQGNVIDPRSLDFDLLVQHDGVDRRGVNRFESQYWRANIDPNERYTLTVAGTVQYRLSPWESGYDNLVLAGDWTYTGFNVGSFEGSVMSGKLASLTLSGAPHVDDIWGYDFLHPDPKVPPAPRIP